MPERHNLFQDANCTSGYLVRGVLRTCNVSRAMWVNRTFEASICYSLCISCIFNLLDGFT